MTTLSVSATVNNKTVTVTLRIRSLTDKTLCNIINHPSKLTNQIAKLLRCSIQQVEIVDVVPVL